MTAEFAPATPAKSHPFLYAKLGIQKLMHSSVYSFSIEVLASYFLPNQNFNRPDLEPERSKTIYD
jgi:hypothetical protein